MGKQQNIEKLESTNAVEVRFLHDYKNRPFFTAGAYLVIASRFPQFTDDNSEAIVFFVCKLACSLQLQQIMAAVNEENFRSPQVVRHRIRSMLISMGCEPVVEIPGKVFCQVLQLEFHYTAEDLKEYRLLPYGEKMKKWIGDNEVVNAEFIEAEEPVV